MVLEVEGKKLIQLNAMQVSLAVVLTLQTLMKVLFKLK